MVERLHVAGGCVCAGGCARGGGAGGGGVVERQPTQTGCATIVPMVEANTTPTPRAEGALHDREQIHFGSDNYAGVHPEVLAAISQANGGHVPGYGDDPYTARLQDVMRSLFGADAVTYPVFNGTGANVLALQAIMPRWGGIVTAASAHINTDENGAPERVAGLKILPMPTPDGKLRAADIEVLTVDRANVHGAEPWALSFSNSTELGTVYTPDEIRELTDAAKRQGLLVHLDGSRLSNAAAATGASFKELTHGVDVVSLGATKNGALAAEAVVVLRPEAAPGIEYLQKINLQLASKQRFLSAQLLACYEGDLWQRNATHANEQARLLAESLGSIPGCSIPVPVAANAVFAVLPDGVADRVREQGFRFYDWPPIPGSVRFMTAWDTPTEAVHSLVDAIRDAITAAS